MKSPLLFSVVLATVLPQFGSCSSAYHRRADKFPVHAGIQSKVAAAWYAGWHASSEGHAFPLSQVPWSKYTHLTYSFAVTTPDVNTLSLEGSDPDLLPQFVSDAKKHGVKALVSVGGWTGSRYFSTNVASARNRTAFVKTITKFVQKYHLDGIDFDWEYPASAGIGCNAVSTSDSANYLAFLQELRKDPIGSSIILTAATATVPFTGANGNVTAFGKLLDYVALMNYDIWGPWSASVGPNAPLNDTCAAPANRAGSAVSAVAAWNAAGIPLNRIVLGVAGYGHSFRVRKSDAFASGSTSVLAPYPAFDSTDRPKGDAWDDGAGVDVCGVQQPDGGNFNFWGLIANGFLKQDGTPASGISYRYDTCSQTPYVYNPSTEVMVSYDDAKSFAAKGSYIKSTGLRGFAMWEAGGDSNNILLNSIRAAGGYQL